MPKSTDRGRGHTSGILDTPRPTRDRECLRLDVVAAMVKASLDGVIVLDSDRRVVYASPAYCELFGYTLDRLLGNNPLPLVAERDRQTVSLTKSAGSHE